MSQNHPIKAYRERQNPVLSQGQFGARVGVTRFTVMRWEGGSKIDLKKLPAVSKAIGVPAKELRADYFDQLEDAT